MDILDPNINTRVAPSMIVETAYDAIANFNRRGGMSNIFYYGYDAVKELCYNRLGVTISKPVYLAVWKTLRLFGDSGDLLTIRVPFIDEPTFNKIRVYAISQEEVQFILVKIEDSKED